MVLVNSYNAPTVVKVILLWYQQLREVKKFQLRGVGIYFYGFVKIFKKSPSLDRSCVVVKARGLLSIGLVCSGVRAAPGQVPRSPPSASCSHLTLLKKITRRSNFLRAIN